MANSSTIITTSSSSPLPSSFLHRAQAIGKPGASASPATTTTTATKTIAIPLPLNPATPRSQVKSRSRSRTGPPNSLAINSSHPLNIGAAAQRPQSSPSASQEISPSISYLAHRPNSSGSELRPTPAKRPPASRSSHGIATSTGPPPALSTQRTQSTDSWRWLSVEDSSPAYPKLTPRALARLNAENIAGTGDAEDLNGGSHVGQNKDENSEGERKIEEPPSEDREAVVPMATITKGQHRYTTEHSALLSGSRRDPKRLSAQFSGDTQNSQGRQSQSSHEDLFLDIAKTDDNTGVASAAEKRVSRIALPAHRANLSHNDAKLADSNVGEDMDSSPLVRDRRESLQRVDFGAQARTPQSADRSNSLKSRTYATSAHPLEQRYRNRMSSGTPKPLLMAPRLTGREALPDSPGLMGRRSSIPDSSGYSRTYRSSHLQHAMNGNYQSSPLAGRNGSIGPEPSPPPLKTEESASTVSTTAPSTVWDELDDLKSRIKKLELTGHLPLSSGAAISNASERPRTAATTVTTISSSPKRARGHSISPEMSSIETDESSLHPLLTSALAKSQPFITPEVYHALETTASDALTMAKMTNGNSGQAPAPSAIDRQLKRKADSLCRSLTELCIALSENKPEDQSGKQLPQPTSRDILQINRRGSVGADHRPQRTSSLEPEATSARVLSRLEARRISILGTNGLLNGINHGAGSGNNSPAREPHLEATTPTQSTLSRTSTVLQRIRGRNPDDEADTTVRPLSRAMTERGSSRSAASKRVSRDYTSQHPLPSPESWSPAAQQGQSALPARRVFLNSGSVHRNQHQQDAAHSQSQLQQRHQQQQMQGTPSTPTTVVGSGPGPGSAIGLTRRYLERTNSEQQRVDVRQQRLQSLGLSAGPSARTPGVGIRTEGRVPGTG